MQERSQGEKRTHKSENHQNWDTIKKMLSCPLLSETYPVTSIGMAWPSYHQYTQRGAKQEKAAEEMLCLHLEGLWGPSAHSPAVYRDRETRPRLSNL